MASSSKKLSLKSLFDLVIEIGLGGSSSTFIGLSIGTSSIKLVELKKNKNNWKLLHFGMVQLPEDSVVNREIINSVAITESINTLINQIKLKNKFVCTSISGTSLIIKTLTLEVENKKELQDQVFWEAEQYLPFDISEVVMDYQVISKSKENKTEVILVAVKKTVLDSYMDCIESSGLKVKIVDVDFFALQNIYEANYPSNVSEAVAIVDMGASSIKIVVVQQGIPVFTKDSAIGGRNLTAEIQKNLNLSYIDAESLKVGGGQDGSTPQEVSDLIHLMADNFTTEIKRALDYYNASATGAPVAYVLLAGGCSKITGVSKIIEDGLGLPTQILNPFNAISYDPAVFTSEYLNHIGPIAAIPMGLALRAGAK